MKNEKTRNKSRILYPNVNKCERCKSDINVIRHHSDYNKPELVMFLCRSCHLIWHHKNKVINSDGSTAVKISRNGHAGIISRMTIEMVKNNRQLSKQEVLDLILEEEFERCTKKMDWKKVKE